MNTDSPKKLWTPSQAFINDSNLTAYLTWVNREYDQNFRDYDDLWAWSVADIALFWESILLFFKVDYSGAYSEVLTGKMPETNWFEGIEISYAEHIFRQRSVDRPAIIFKNESSPTRELSWLNLEQKVASLQEFLVSKGVGFGDRVAAYLPNIPEAIISFLAVNGLGAIWTSTSPDFGTDSVVDRISQIKPKVLISIESYQYGGKIFDKSPAVQEIIKRIASIENLILIDESDNNYPGVETTHWSTCVASQSANLQLKRVPFNHPIWVLYSSGTTGIPKAITHSCGGILLEHLKYLSFHNNVKSGDRCFWYTTIGWMMWNYIQASMLCGGTVVLYDGSLTYPNIDSLWNFAADTKINHFGVSAGFITTCMKEELKPGNSYNLESLVSIGSTGSPLPPEGFNWIYSDVKKDLWLTSISGGSDICSAFVGGNPHWPVYSGEIQCRALGIMLEAFDEDGRVILDEVGEMVITKPMPSMPIYLWGDENQKRYLESYFNTYPGIWRHGDWTKITSRNGVIIYGRSDSTLNRGGVRIGTAEIYRAVDTIDEVADSLIVYYTRTDGDERMPLFIKLQEGVECNAALVNLIKTTIRSRTSPRHVPDAIIEIPDIPYTISGKKMETPVKKILEGVDPALVVKRDAMRNPDSIQTFIEIANK